MPSDKRNSITTKAMGLIISLFNVASAEHVPFGIPQYVQCILHRPPLIFANSERCRFDGSARWLPFVMEIARTFLSGYFDCRDAFCTVLDS